VNRSFAKSANGILVCVSVMLIMFINALTSPLLTNIAAELQLDVATAGYLPTITTLFMGVALFTATWMLSWFGLRFTVICAMLLVTAGSLCTFFLKSFFLQLICRAFVGIGMGTMGTCFSTIAATWFNGKGRSAFVTIYTLGNTLASYLAFIVAIPFFQLMGQSWRSCYLVTGVLSVVCTLGWILFGRNTPADAAENTKSAGSHSIFREVLADRDVWVLSAYHGLATLCTNVITNYLPSFLQLVRGFSADQAANWSGIISLTGILGTIIGGSLSTWLGKRRPVLASGTLLSLLSMAGILLCKQPILIVICIGLFGFSARYRIPPTTSASTELRANDSAFAAGAYAVMYAIGSFIGIFAPFVLSRATHLFGMARSMLLFVAFLLIAFICSLFVRETGQSSAQ